MFDNDDVDKEVDRFDSTKSVYQYDAHELEQFADYTQRAENLKDFLEFNGTSIRLTMENQDWLHMFGSAIAHYGMDMNAIFRYTTSTDDKSAHGQTTAEQYLKEMRARFGD